MSRKNYELRIMNQEIFPTFSKTIPKFKEITKTRKARLLLAFMFASITYLPLGDRGYPLSILTALRRAVGEEEYFIIFIYILFSSIWYVIWSILIYKHNRLSMACTITFILWAVLPFIIPVAVPYNMIFLPILLFIFSFVHILFRSVDYFHKLIKYREATWTW